MDMFEAMKPYLWLAAVAFMVGFVSYLTLGRPASAVAREEAVWPAAITAPASAPVSDAWNVPKQI
jgi:hypothetical protein